MRFFTVLSADAQKPWKANGTRSAIPNVSSRAGLLVSARPTCDTS